MQVTSAQRRRILRLGTALALLTALPTDGASRPVLSVGNPFPMELVGAEHLGEFQAELARIRSLLPEATHLGLFFDVATTDAEDWLAVLDECQARGFQVTVTFAQSERNGRVLPFRPEFLGGRWQWRAMGDFVSDRRVVTHPALYAVQTVDEPWHGTKTPFYTSADLQAMYQDLHSLAPGGTSFRLQLQFSRELWKRQGDERTQWQPGMADVVQISALEFQDSAYQFDLLDQNHTVSRRIVHAKTPQVPLWTSVQVFGGRYGPGPGYWFPRERDGHHELKTLLDDLTDSKYESEHPLTGMMLQQWDSTSVSGRSRQYVLGDRDEVGTPVTQAAAGSSPPQSASR